MVSPPGVGGISIIQVVGPDAIARTATFLRRRTADQTPALRGERIALVRWVDDDKTLDDVIVAVDRRDSAQQTVTITTHGSVRVVERLLMCLQRGGVTIRRQLPAARCWPELNPIERALMDHLGSAQTKRVGRWLLQQAPALMQAIEESLTDWQQGRHSAVILRLRQLLQTLPISRMLLDGAQVVIVGPPNAGKSTLANRLFTRPWSLESDDAGTTRDWVHQPTAFMGVPVVLADTAGLRESSDALEMEAQRHAHPLIRQSDAQILVLDATHRGQDARRAWLEGLLDDSKLIVAFNKIDLLSAPNQLADFNFGSSPPILVSALERCGLDDLRRAVLGRLGLTEECWPSPAIWDSRQRRALESVLKHGHAAPETVQKMLRRSFLGPGRRT